MSKYDSTVSVISEMWKVIVVIVIFLGFHSTQSQFFECRNDPTYRLEEGPLEDLQFTWLGALQYIHVKKGTPHFFRVPRVVLVSRQFVISTAVDAAQVPEGYALGNVAFGEYERDEVECGLTAESLASSVECESAVFLVPLSDVLLHPEYKNFGASDSIALLKLLIPIQSRYMVPACLPLKNNLKTKNEKEIRDKIYHVDFSSDVPIDFMSEEKEITKLLLVPKELCYLYSTGIAQNNSDPIKERIICTTGCGFHSGAPSMIHERTGHWSIVSLAQGGPPCPDPLISRKPPPPPRHIQIHPYVPWISTAIAGKAVGVFEKDDPFGLVLPRAMPKDPLGQGWNGHWWMAGMACYNRGEAAKSMFKFYYEIFQVRPEINTTTRLTYYLEIMAAHGANTVCVKVGMPYQLVKPRVWDLNSPQTKVRIPVLKFRGLYRFQVEAWAYNASEDSSGGTSDDSKDSDDS